MSSNFVVLDDRRNITLESIFPQTDPMTAGILEMLDARLLVIRANGNRAIYKSIEKDFCVLSLLCLKLHS